ncbi:MAG: ornithine--oxo-acid transaminase [bacterium]|nr:ornithine--oxo-acid transaminase [bacterium]
MSLTEQFIKEAEKYSAHNYHPLPVVLSKGEGVWVWDVEGKKYLDCLSAYSAVNQGHRHPKIINALIEQANRITLTSRAFHNDKMGAFLKKLCEVAGFDKALPMNTGAEAVETAIKTARKWGYLKKKVEEDKAEIIVCENNFHGRTITIISFSSEPQYRFGFGPFTPGFKMIPFGDAEALEKAITPNTVGFLVEPIQGEGGVIVPPEGYYKAIREITKKHNVLLMADEIQTGFGRTGTLFAMDREGVKPDILIVGKALGGGVYPVSAILANEEVMDVFRPGDHGSTFGGNPLAAAVAMAAIDVIVEERLPERAEELGNYFMKRLREINSPYVKEVRGRGLLIGVEIKKEYGSARPFCEKLMELGILAKETHEQVIRFAPPLVITKEEIDWALERIEKVLKA